MQCALPAATERRQRQPNPYRVPMVPRVFEEALAGGRAREEKDGLLWNGLLWERGMALW